MLSFSGNRVRTDITTLAWLTSAATQELEDFFNEEMPIKAYIFFFFQSAFQMYTNEIRPMRML